MRADYSGRGRWDRAWQSRQTANTALQALVLLKDFISVLMNVFGEFIKCTVLVIF